MRQLHQDHPLLALGVLTPMLHEVAPSKRLARPEHAAWLRMLLAYSLGLARRLFHRIHMLHVGCELMQYEERVAVAEFAKRGLCDQGIWGGWQARQIIADCRL